jgi:uncharacterized protein
MRRYQDLHDEVFDILHSRLPSYLTYHTPDHTAYVIAQSEMISRHENVDDYTLFLIKTAALFHDIGFIEQNKDHEEKGCEICWKMLTRYKFTTEEIYQICGMIYATKIPQQPTTLSEKIVADADLEYLGTDLFSPISQGLFKEFQHFDPTLDIDGFNKIQIDFIRHHHYHTTFCLENREAKKQKNLQDLLDSMTSDTRLIH